MGSFAYAMTGRMYVGKNWVNDRSACDSCGHTLNWYDLVPLLSWVSARGKCRYCSAKLSPVYPGVELLSAAALLVSYIHWPYGWSGLGVALFVLWLVMLTLLISLVIFDLSWFLLPDKIVYTLVGLAFVQQILIISYSWSLSSVPGIIAGALVGSGLFYALFALSGGRYIGGGDVKYGLFFGILLGSGVKSLMVIGFASVLGTLVTLPFMLGKKGALRTQIPFGPFLIAATMIVYLHGDKIINAYSTLYLFP